MPRSIQKHVALLLALVYGGVGLYGYGLHALVPCGDSSCCGDDCGPNQHDSQPKGAVSHGTCDCAWHAAAADASPLDSATASPDGHAHLDVAHNVHSADDCLICALLAQLKAGHVDLPPPAGADAVAASICCFDSLFSLAPLPSVLARGPPHV